MEKQNIISQNIAAALHDYQQMIKNDDSSSQNDQNQLEFTAKQSYYKEKHKTINLKPLNFHKDLIYLQQQNKIKKAQVNKLKCINEKVRKQYQQQVANNSKIQQFLKDIEFTFSSSLKNKKSDEILIKAKKKLNKQVCDYKKNIINHIKKPQASEIHKLKITLCRLQIQKQRLIELIDIKKQSNLIKKDEQDFNSVYEQKYKNTCNLVKQYLIKDRKNIQKKYQQDDIQLLKIRNNLKNKNIQYKKQEIEIIYQELKNILFIKQGIEYQINIIKRQKNYKKQYLNDIDFINKEINLKQKNIIQLKKQIKQKEKSLDYMIKWDLEMKNKLNSSKQQHIKQKRYYQQKINILSKEFQQWNHKYKKLMQQLVQNKLQEEDKKIQKERINGKNIQVCHFNQYQKIRVVKLEEIKSIARKITWTIISLGYEIIPFIKQQLCETIKDENIDNKNSEISFQKLFKNCEQISSIIAEDSDLSKMVRYIVQDNCSDYSKITSDTTISRKLVQIRLKNLLMVELESPLKIQKATVSLNKLLEKKFDNLLLDIKVGVRENSFDIYFLCCVLQKYQSEELTATRMCECFQFYLWKQFRTVIDLSIQQFQGVCESLPWRKSIKEKRI